MTKILIKKILNKEKVSKAGKPYKACSILTIGKDGQEIWLNSFANSTTESWKDGQTVELDIEKTEFGYKFKEPAERNVFEELDKINDKLDLILFNDKKVDPTVPPQILEGNNKVTGEVSVDEIPF